MGYKIPWDTVEEIQKKNIIVCGNRSIKRYFTITGYSLSLPSSPQRKQLYWKFGTYDAQNSTFFGGGGVINILALWPFQLNQKHKTNSGYKRIMIKLKMYVVGYETSNQK